MHFFNSRSSSSDSQKSFFGVPYFCLGLLGYWPEQRNYGGLNICAVVNFVILAIGVLTELLAGVMYLQHNDIALALETFCPAGTSAVTLLKMFLMLYFRKDLRYVLERLRQMLCNNVTMSAEQSRMMNVNNWRNVYFTLKKQNILRRYTVLSNCLNLWAFSAAFFTCTIYNVKPILIVMFHWLQNQEFTWTTPFNMTIPGVLLHAPFFPLTYIFVAYTGYVIIFMFSGCDGFYFEFCTYVAALLKTLQEDIGATFQPYKFRLVLLSESESIHMESSLIEVIKRHNEIINLVSYFHHRYAIITLAHFLSASLVIGMSIIDMLMYTDLGMLIYIAYTIAALSQLLIYCFGGTMVAENSVALAPIVSSCNWVILRPQQRRTLLLIILRSQRALSMAVPFFSPSLITFAAILHTSGSFIALASSFK